MSQPKTIVVGIDGAHFELIQPWIDAGKLPEIAKILDSGIHGDLESVLPPVTSPNWKAYSTGVNPGRFGIFWWENIDTKAERVYYPDNRKHQRTEFWEIIAQDEPVGVLGVPTTHPPKQIDEFLVAGPPDGKNTGFAHPDTIEQELKTQFDYRVTKKHRLQHDQTAAAEEILALIDSRFEAARHLLSEHDLSFLQVTTFYINSLHHYLWDDETTLTAWQLIDDHIGALREESRNIVLMSDHGANEITTSFYINAWLEKEGYLVTDSTFSDLFHRAGLNLETVEKMAVRLGVRDLVDRLPERVLNIARRLPDESGSVNKQGKTNVVNWDQTDAVASGQGPVYITAPESSNRYDRIQEELLSKLAEVRDDNGNPIASDVYRGEMVYSGEFEDEAPDIVIDQARGVHIQGGLNDNSVFTDPESGGWRAENKRHGLFAAAGPDFSEGTIDSLSILDLAPTLLHLHGYPILTDMDGEVRASLFSDESGLAAEPPETAESSDFTSSTDGNQRGDMDDEVKDRLDDLGYLS